MKIEIPVFAIYLALTIAASAVSAQEPRTQGHGDSGLSPLLNDSDVISSSFAAEVVKQFQDNRLVFHNNYKGKVLQVSGSVWTFYKRQGNPPGIDVMLSGMARKNPDDAQDSDNVCCETTDPKAISSAADLELGKNIVVRGLYDPNLRTNGLESQVILHDCQLR